LIILNTFGGFCTYKKQVEYVYDGVEITCFLDNPIQKENYTIAYTTASTILKESKLKAQVRFVLFVIKDSKFVLAEYCVGNCSSIIDSFID